MKTFVLLAREVGTKTVFDTVVAMLAGALVAFMMMFALHLVFTQAWYEAGLNYDEYRESDTPAAVSVLRTAEVVFAAEATYISEYGYMPDSAAPVARIFEPDDAEAVRGVLGASLARGTLGGSGVVIDEAQAVRLDLGIGDRVVLRADTSDFDSVECIVPITGIARPYMTADDYGQILLPRGLCEEVDAALLAETPGTWEVYGDGGAAKWQRIASIVWNAPTPPGLLLGILGVGTALWVLVSLRAASRVARVTRSSAMTLVRSGVTPRSVRGVAWSLGAVSAVLGAAGAVLLAGLAMRLVTLSYTQAALMWFIGILMVLAAGIAQWIKLRGWPVRGVGSKE